MAIAAVGGQAGGNVGASVTSVAKAFTGNITAGSLIVVVASKGIASPSDAFVTGDCTKTAGTATIGTISFDVSRNQDITGAFMSVGIWSAIVTGTGSCTMTVGGASAASQMTIAVNEYTGSWDSGRVEATNNAGTATDNVTAVDTGNATSAGAALFVAGMSAARVANVDTSPDGAYTQIYENEVVTAGSHLSAIHQIVGSGTTDSGSWTIIDNLGWACALAVYKEATAGGGSFNATRDQLTLTERATSTNFLRVAIAGTRDQLTLTERTATVRSHFALAATVDAFTLTERAAITSVVIRQLRLTSAEGYELRDHTNALVASVSGIIYEWYDDPDDTDGNPTQEGTFNTDASGEAVIALTSSTLGDGEFGGLVLIHPSDPTIRGYYRVAVNVTI